MHNMPLTSALEIISQVTDASWNASKPTLRQLPRMQCTRKGIACWRYCPFEGLGRLLSHRALREHEIMKIVHSIQAVLAQNSNANDMSLGAFLMACERVELAKLSAQKFLYAQAIQHLSASIVRRRPGFEGRGLPRIRIN